MYGTTTMVVCMYRVCIMADACLYVHICAQCVCVCVCVCVLYFVNTLQLVGPKTYHCYSIQVAPFASQNNIPRLLQSVAKIRNVSSTLWKVTHHQNECFSSVFAISHPHTQAVKEFLHCTNFSACARLSDF